MLKEKRQDPALADSSDLQRVALDDHLDEAMEPLITVGRFRPSDSQGEAAGQDHPFVVAS